MILCPSFADDGAFLFGRDTVIGHHVNLGAGQLQIHPELHLVHCDVTDEFRHVVRPVLLRPGFVERLELILK